MSEDTLRAAAENHAAAVVRGDVPAVLADLDPSLHDHVPAMVAAMPGELSGAELSTLQMTDSGGTTRTRYDGSTGSVVVVAQWELRGDQYVVTTAAPEG